MNLWDREQLKTAAGEALRKSSCSPKKLILIHTGVSVAVAFLAALANIFLTNRIGATGGLGGLQMRSMLTSILWLLQMAQMIVLPFWEIGYYRASMNMARVQPTETKDLLEGFRLFGPVLRYTLLRSLIFAGIGIFCFYVSIQIFLISPLSNNLFDVLEPFASDITALEPDFVFEEETILAMERAMLPLVIVFGAVYLAASLPLMYRYRMAVYCLMDQPGNGAWAALRDSRRMMRFNCMDLFKLDLSFWWYYVIQILLTVLCYGDLILGMLGVSVPWSETAGAFLFAGASQIGELVLYYFARNQLEATYVLAYDTVHPPLPHHPENHTVL